MPDLATDLDYPEPKASDRPLVISHYPCMDGFTAAWAMWLKYPNAEFVHGVHGQAPPDCTGRDVYLLDFSYKLPAMQKLIEQAEKVIVLDHHKSAQEDLKILFEGVEDTDLTCGGKFDMEKSGARLAWEWFHPGVEVPLFVRLVEDRDLWRFALDNSKELSTFFFSFDYSFEKWTELAEAMENEDGYELAVHAGIAILRKQDKDVRELVGKTMQMKVFPKIWDLHPILVPVANLPYTLSSDAAGLMAETAPFAATYYTDSEGQFVFSLRSRGADGVDVSEIALRYGGGGHRNAAGFRIASLGEL